MKIAHIIPHFHGIGGVQVCVHNISERHARKGHDVRVFCRKNHSNPGLSYKKEPFLHFRFTPRTFPIGKWWMSHYITRLQNKHQFDVWQINGGYPYGILLGDFFSTKIPCVLRCSGEDIQVDLESNYGVRLKPVLDRSIKKDYKKLSTYVAITETVRQEYIKIGIPDKKIKIIPNGVDFKRISGATGTNDIRKQYNLPEPAKVILTVGRNHPKKGCRFISEILKQILSQGVDAYWIVVGKGSARIPGIEVLKGDLDRIICVEAISFDTDGYEIPSDKLIRYYKSADVFAMPSHIETFGIVLIEAMAAGLPVVCFDVPGVRDVMNTKCGTACELGDIDSFAHALNRIWGNLR